MKEISLEELNKLNRDDYELIDIRDEGPRTYGMMPGAIAIPLESDFEQSVEMLSEIPADKKLIFYCDFGRKTAVLDEGGPLEGRDCYSLQGGYTGYICAQISDMGDLEERRKKAELSIRKKFHKTLFSPFAKACKMYHLIEEGDNIAVCISGGKDSMLMAKLFQEIQKHRQCNFELTFLVMD